MIPDSIVQLFAADQIKIFLERSMAIFKSKMAFLGQKLPFFLFLTFDRHEGISIILKSMIPDSNNFLLSIRCKFFWKDPWPFSNPKWPFLGLLDI